LVTGLFERDSLAGIIFLLYRNEEPVFPLFRTGSEENTGRTAVAYDSSLQQQIKNSEDAEYIQNDYLSAASIYNDAFQRSGNRTGKIETVYVYHIL
jgi:hypothetical protein